MAENIIDVRIDLINTVGRFRKDFGDLTALAGSIKELGLLQPIGIDAGYQLVFGERRLRAFKLLGRETIPVRFVNLDSLIKGELAENDCRKDFTPSERVAIGAAIEAELRKRLGANQHTKEGPENLPDPTPKGDTRDLVAKATGFGNGKTYEQAKSVVKDAAPELVEAMDAGKVSVSAAAAIAQLPKAEQVTIAKQEPREIKAAAKIAKAKARDPLPEVKPAATAHVLKVINAMDVLLRHMQQDGLTMEEMADAFLAEVDLSVPAISDRIKATLPVMRSLGRIASELEVA